MSAAFKPVVGNAPCEAKVGYLLVRPCGVASESQCSHCHKSLCRDHVRFALSDTQEYAYCFECYPHGSTPGPSDDTFRATQTRNTQSSDSDTGDSYDDDSSYLVEDTLTEADVAAFDEVAEFDGDQDRSDLYDS